jgi:hypothetical protein
VPVPIEQYADEALRRTWHDEGNMMVFQVWRERDRSHQEVDLFLEVPFPFAEAYAQAFWRKPAEDAAPIPFLDRKRLIGMKRVANRPQDLADIDCLEKLHGPA